MLKIVITHRSEPNDYTAQIEGAPEWSTGQTPNEAVGNLFLDLYHAHVFPNDLVEEIGKLIASRTNLFTIEK